jgi:hypothetical protein
VGGLRRYVNNNRWSVNAKVTQGKDQMGNPQVAALIVSCGGSRADMTGSFAQPRTGKLPSTASERNEGHSTFT